MRLNRRFIVIAAACAALAACGDKSGPASASSGGAPVGIRTMGKADAPVKLVEYASMACPHCMEFNNLEFPALKAKYIDTGKVHYELREMLTPPNEVAAAAFLLAECSGPNGYFETIDAIFADMQQSNQLPDLEKVAKARGLDFEKCLGDEEAIKGLNARLEVNSPKITGTPTFFINDVKYEGPNTAADLGKAIDAATAAK